MARNTLNIDGTIHLIEQVRDSAATKISSTAGFLSSEIGKSIIYIEADNILKTLKEVKAAGGELLIRRPKHVNFDELAKTVNKAVRRLGETSPVGTPMHRFSTYIT